MADWKVSNLFLNELLHRYFKCFFQAFQDFHLVSQTFGLTIDESNQLFFKNCSGDEVEMELFVVIVNSIAELRLRS